MKQCKIFSFFLKRNYLREFIEFHFSGVSQGKGEAFIKKIPPFFREGSSIQTFWLSES